MINVVVVVDVIDVDAGDAGAGAGVGVVVVDEDDAEPRKGHGDDVLMNSVGHVVDVDLYWLLPKCHVGYLAILMRVVKLSFVEDLWKLLWRLLLPALKC